MGFNNYSEYQEMYTTAKCKTEEQQKDEFDSLFDELQLQKDFRAIDMAMDVLAELSKDGDRAVTWLLLLGELKKADDGKLNMVYALAKELNKKG